MSGIYVGGVEVPRIFIGSTPVRSAYLGSVKIWPKWSPIEIVGNNGAYYEFGVGLTSLGIHRCYQDTARTNPCTADGHIIKSLSDLSGNGRHISAQGNPVLRQDAQGWCMRREAGQSGIAFSDGGLADNVQNGSALAICVGTGSDSVGTAIAIASYHRFPTNLLLQWNSLSSSAIGMSGQGVGPSGAPNLSFTDNPSTSAKTTYLYKTIYQNPNTNFYAYKNGSLTVLTGSNNGFAGKPPTTNSTFSIGHHSHKLRAVIYVGSKSITDAEWIQLDAYWQNTMTGAQWI